MLKEFNKKLYDPVDNKYDFDMLMHVLTRFLDCKQFDNESLIDYTKRFKETADNLENFLGENFLTDFIKTTKKYQDCVSMTKRQKLLKDGFKYWILYIYVHNANRKMYRKLMLHLTLHYSLKTDHFPKNMKYAQKVLTGHKWDKALYKHQKNKKDQQKSGNSNGKSSKSKSSGTKENKEEDNGQMFTQKDIICFCCGKHGHYSENCPFKDKITKSE